MYDQVTHVGRSWVGHPIEDECGCVQQPCGLVVFGDKEDCPEHGALAAKTFRQIHFAKDCPGSAAEVSTDESDESFASPFAKLTEILEEVKAAHDMDRVSTHYVGCWKYHVPCLTILLEDTIQDIQGDPADAADAKALCERFTRWSAKPRTNSIQQNDRYVEFSHELHAALQKLLNTEDTSGTDIQE